MDLLATYDDLSESGIKELIKIYRIVKILTQDKSFFDELLKIKNSAFLILKNFNHLNIEVCCLIMKILSTYC